MKSLLFLFAAVLATAVNVHAQNFPIDLEVTATAGGKAPGAAYATIQIAADGQVSYERLLGEDLAAPPGETNAFTVNTGDLEDLWQAIESNDFFNLDRRYVNNSIIDGTFAILVVKANGNTHTVTVENTSVSQFDAIMEAINDLMPAENELDFSLSTTGDFVSRDICEQEGNKRIIDFSKRPDKSTGLRTEVARVPAPHNVLNGEAHAGTVVGYRISLQDAVDQGIVSLSGKGDVFYGDAVSITADNTSGVTTDRLSLSLYLELYGPVAVPEIAQDVKAAIENEWSGKTTNSGKVLDVEVFTRTLLGATSPPGTAGYHQIKMVTGEFTSFVSGEFGINSGVGGGTWSINGNGVNETYAHEAGHLFDLEDRYDEYEKQDDGSWVNTGNNDELTSEELAKEVAPHEPDLTEAQITEKLNEKSRKRITVPQEGSGDDIMASIKDSDPIQADIDAFAMQAGLIIEIRPGNILINKDGEQQNFMITRWEDLFVPFGEEKQLDGIYAACIDLLRDTPSLGAGFDVAPSLSAWRNIESASILQQLADYINAEEAYCGDDIVPQEAIWRITNNDDIGDPEVDAFVSGAGIEFGDQIFDFPRMSNPNAGNPESTTLTPAELLVPVITSAGSDLLAPGETVSLTGSIEIPTGENPSAAYTWTLVPSPGSMATLTNTAGANTSFTADVRGLYRVILEAQVSSPAPVAGTIEKRTLFSFADAATETFESGVLPPGRPFYWETAAENPWRITSGAANTGTYALVTPDLKNDESTTLTVRFTQAAEEALLFAFKLSSEENFDFFTVVIDGVTQASLSGEIDWTGLWIPLPAGAHTVSWTYQKDESASEGADLVWIDDVFFPESAVFTSIESTRTDGLPATHGLLQNYPNPFSANTTISYSLPEPEHVSLTIYDALGRQVTRLVDGMQGAGWYRIPFDAGTYANGMYYYELRAGTFEERRAMILSR